MKAVLSKFHRCRTGTTPMRTLDCGKVQVMKGIKDIILKGSIFAVLTAVFCVGGIPSAPLVSTARAEGEITSDKTNWSGEMILTGEDDVTVSDPVTLTADTTLTVAEGRKLTLNGGISGGPYTLTVNGSGEVIINGKGGTDGCDGIQGNSHPERRNAEVHRGNRRL